MSTIAVFFADGFEEIEALTVVDLCRRAGVDTNMISVTGNMVVTGSHNIPITTDMLIDDVDFESVDMIVLPGGMPGTLNLEKCSLLMEQVKSFDAKGKYISAICAAPTVLGRLGILKDKTACCYPSMEEELICKEVGNNPVETVGHIMTSRGMGTAMDLGLAIVECFKGRDVSKQLAQAVVYNK